MKKRCLAGLLSVLALIGVASFANADAIKYSAAVLADNPYAYWKLDDVSGGIATDSSGHGFDGALYGNVAIDNMGAFEGSNAFDFDGAGDFIEITSGTWGGGSALTIEAWYHVDHLSNDFQAIVSSLDSGEFAHLQLNEGGNVVGYVNGGGGVVALDIIPETPINEWFHVTLVLSTGNSSIYLNGVEFDSSSTSFSNIFSTDTIRIGSGHQGGRFFNGSIDDVAVYNYALTMEQIESHIEAASAPIPEPTTMFLLGSGLIGLAGFRGRFRKR
ncbi:MAG: PEP-CTERM sorting domain-containing protein [Deltaproteobacteria bacterium]|nr:PEP-CTERM sorting domain-containing protein [Deltaproteobacteria bacterium]